MAKPYAVNSRKGKAQLWQLNDFTRSVGNILQHQLTIDHWLENCKKVLYLF